MHFAILIALSIKNHLKPLVGVLLASKLRKEIRELKEYNIRQ